MKFAGATRASRARVLFSLLLLGLAALIARTGYIQVVRGDEFARRASKQHFRIVTVPAPRGRILDRHGRQLAASYHSRSVACDPRDVPDVAAFSAEVALLLGEPRAAGRLRERVAGAAADGRHFVYLRRWADRDVVDRLESADLPGLDLREEPRREYPHGPLAAAVVGMVGPDGAGRNAGLTGLERHCDAVLRGRDGSCAVFRSGSKSERFYHLFPEEDAPPRPGDDVLTTLDVVLQQIAEDALDTLVERHTPRTACAVVLRPGTGEILALAGRPALDPAAFPRVPRESLRVPAVQNSYEPGSTMKPLVMAWALTRGAVHPGQRIDCGPGWKLFGRRKLSDVKPHGVLDLEDVLVRSSNIGIAQVGMALGIDEVYAYFHALGFARPTGVEISGEQSGRILPRARWTENYTLTSVSMGHAFTVTPLQLATAYAALLNDGHVLRPTLLLDAERPAPRRLPYTRDALAFVRHAMERVVEEGTGRRARVEGLRIGGKTGTSEKYPEGCGKYVSSFVGFAPADDPQMLVLVLADEPKSWKGLKPYGGVVAAPAVREILLRGLPIVRAYARRAPPESGVRHPETSAEKVRVAAVNWSSVNAGTRMVPAIGRNPDSVGAEACRSER